ncbi:Abi family protein, partial [Bacillus subtilis]|nr:Abi family protein [Bacillus subtilis]
GTILASVFDCRFRKSNPPARLKSYLQSETSISNIQFDNIVDYFIIVIFILKKLGITKTELKRLIRNFHEESEQLRNNIPVSVHTSIMGSDLKNKIKQLKNYI